MKPLSAAQIKARYAEAQRLHEAGKLREAAGHYSALADLAPALPEIPFQLARIAETTGRYRDGLAQVGRALTLRPKEPALHELAARLAVAAGDRRAAMAAHDAVIRLRPGALKPRADKAHYLQTIGRFDEAEAILRKLIAAHPTEGELYRMLVGGTRLDASDPLIGTMQRAWDGTRLTDAARLHLGFALAKAMEDTGDTARMFPYLHRANALQRAAHPYDRGARDAEVDGVLARQDAAPLDPVGEAAEPRPVFVTGMPRSGTTLVERIIAAHPAASAAGELGVALKLAYGLFGAGAQMRPLATLSAEDLARFARAYLARLRGAAGAEAQAVTDKSIQTHLILGLLHRALPGARFIVVHRDPRDIALSVYKNHFAVGTHRYANDLADIAHYTKSFRRAVAFWRPRLAGVLHEVRYEDLVGDPEPEARRLLAAAGLDWDPRCLDFHAGDGAVKTLSVSQVREPIHAGRAAAWRRYETELQPFFDAWGDAPWD